MPKVSIIVPSYNYAHLLPRCLDSLVGQTLKDIEIIIVDDCSTDNTAEVVQPYLRDGRIKYIKNESQQRTYLSRNIGMRAAQGDYLSFCDADDFYELDAMELMYTLAQKTGADIIAVDVVHNKYNVNIPPHILPNPTENISVFMHFLRTAHRCSMWSMLYKRECIESFLTYAPNLAISYAEDYLANFILHSFAQKKAYLQKPLYHYVRNPLSISKDNTLKGYLCKLSDLEHIVLAIRAFLGTRTDASEIEDLMFRQLIDPNLFHFAMSFWHQSAWKCWEQYAPAIFKERLSFVLMDYYTTTQEKNRPIDSIGIKDLSLHLMKKIILKIRRTFK